MYGPPPDPRQQLAPVEIFDCPEAYIACFLLGGLVSALGLVGRWPAWLRAGAFVLGQTIVLTAPLAYFLDDYVYGSFPTIDKAGSMAFYLDGLHHRVMAHPIDSIQDPAARLVGVHVGHLWVTWVFDWLFSPMGAFNAQALLYPFMAWWVASLLFYDLTGNLRGSVLMSFPFGLGLHVFRDLNWYTIEKAAIFWIPLFLLMLHRVWRDGGRWTYAAPLVLLLSTWMNIYLGMLNAGFMVLALLAVLWVRDKAIRRFGLTCALCVVAIAPLVFWQWLMLRVGPQLGTPETFLWERAALDTFTLSPPRWNRLEAHRALNLVVLGVAFWGFHRIRWVGMIRFLLVVAIIFFGLSLGPFLDSDGTKNPLYLVTRAIVPGFWRVAKPEVFFHMTWLLVSGIAAFQANRAGWSKRLMVVMYIIFVAGWLVMVRSHPAYPPMTMPVGVKLDPNWEDRVFGS